MSESSSKEQHVQALKATYGHLSFIHNKFLTTQFYLEEAKHAESAMLFIQEMANKVVNEIHQIEPPKVEDVKKEASTNV